MAGTVDVGTGTTVTFGTSSFAAEITGLTLNDITIAKINTHHMGTTGAITKRSARLYDPGSITLDLHLDPDDPDTSAPFDGTEETVTITFPVPTGKSSGATLAATAAMGAFGGTVPLEDKMVARMRVDFHDDLTWTDSAV